MLELVQELEGRSQMAILSNTSAMHWPMIRELPVVDRLIKFGAPCILSHEVGAMKPDARMYHVVLERLGTTAGACVYIDDIAAYVEAAQDLGMQGVVYDCRTQSVEELRQALMRVLA